MLFKLIKAYIKKNIRKQVLLPKDLFDFKGILCAGTDSQAFKEKIEYFFGTRPLEIFGGTEIATVAVETWSRKGLTFFPDVNFLEFIPEKDSMRSLIDKNFIPKTRLINELEINEKYELVTTKFRGGAFVRYRVGDMIECVALDDKKHGIHLPQIRYVDRISNVIDLVGFTRITEVTLDKALALANLDVCEWVACKEYINNEPLLHMYLEMKHQSSDDVQQIKTDLHKNLQELDADYRDIEKLLGRDLLKVTLLEQGTFKKHYKENEQHNKINPGKEIIQSLCRN